MTSITSKPDHGATLIEAGKANQPFQVFLDDLESGLNQVVGAQVTLTSYTVATLPPVISAPGMIFVSNESGGSVMAFSDGISWRRCTDRAIVS